jgi:hypothetical protein
MKKSVFNLMFIGGILILLFSSFTTEIKLNQNSKTDHFKNSILFVNVPLPPLPHSLPITFPPDYNWQDYTIIVAWYYPTSSAYITFRYRVSGTSTWSYTQDIPLNGSGSYGQKWPITGLLDGTEYEIQDAVSPSGNPPASYYDNSSYATTLY